MRLLRQSTGAHVVLGPIVDITDAVTPKTSLTLGDISAYRHVEVSGGTAVASTALTLAASGDNELTHQVDGYWELDLTATDSGTLGKLRVSLRDDDVFLPIWEDFMVVTANIYDSYCAADKLDASVTQWLGTAVATPTVAGVPEVDITHVAGSAAKGTSFGTAIDTSLNLVKSNLGAVSDDTGAAVNMEAMYDSTGYAGGVTPLEVSTRSLGSVGAAGQVLDDIMREDRGTPWGQVGAGPTTTTFVLAGLSGFSPSSNDDQYNGRRALFLTGTLAGHAADISDYNGTTKEVTVSTLPATPTATDQVAIIG